MKRLSKMAYELRDVTIFYQRMVRQMPVDEIAFDHKRSKARIYQILDIQKQRYTYYVKNQTNMYKQYWTESLMGRYVMQNFYHYEIGLILQRYYIRIKKK